ncbi:MAG: DUF5686 and carboxypeptidase regulatory-like domain-containing protein [Bacteroidales bacterium]|nr:DUF5686 and carboxypeptidase regulatory-like domain-containing protein [Bacteroidales bacterium]
MRIQLLIFFLFLLKSVISQSYMVKGVVVDSKTRETLAFVNIVINHGNLGGTSDIDGRFTLYSDIPINHLTFSYVGYKKNTIEVTGKEDLKKIELVRTEISLPEYVVYPEENPAHRIINNAIANQNLNNPEKMEAFSYTSYDKMIFTLEPDSLPAIDSIMSADTTDGLLKYLEGHHFFIMETVSERKFKAPDRNLENVVASRISGFKDPIFVFLLSQWQRASFYDEIITISDKNYVNPISRGSTRKYFFMLEDTLYPNNIDSVFIISYRPFKYTNFDGLSGILSINSNQWAIQNVIAEPARYDGGIGMRFQQMYEWIDNKHWFPVQVNTEIILNSIYITDTTLTLGVAGEPDRSVTFGVGKSYIRDINFEPEFRRGEFGHVEIDVDPNAGNVKPEIWKKYRVDSLDYKEINTYKFVDSIGKEIDLDKYALVFESVTTGRLPWGKFDLDLNRFLRYNSYEGFAPGVGIHTNERLSRAFKVGGFGRYGIKDKEWKYGGDFSVMINRYYELEIGGIWEREVEESGGVSFFSRDFNLLNPANFREFLIKNMDLTDKMSAFLNFRAFHYFKFYTDFSVKRKESTTDYRYVIPSETLKVYTDTYDFTTFSLGFRFAYKEKFVQNIRKKLSLGTNYPVVIFTYTRGLEGVLNGDPDFKRYDIPMSKSLNYKYLVQTSIVVNGGYIDADIPATDLYAGRAGYRPFTIYAPVSFATMRMNEFLSNKYLSFYFTHNFRKLLMRLGRFEPEFAVAFNASIGWLDFKQSHAKIDYKTMENGYYEAGFLINNLLNLRVYSLGLGVFYRFGPYSMDKTHENFAGKLTLTFPY